MSHPIFTIGHSKHSIDQFLELLGGQAIQAIADVRSAPYSSYQPQYNRALLTETLKGAGLAYVFLGVELGARRIERECYLDGRADYARVACLPAFQDGLQRLLDGRKKMRIALLCAEQDPLDCHRAILVARHLQTQGAEVRHIMADGAIETHVEMEARLAAVVGINTNQMDIFSAPENEAPLERAYRIRGERIAYQEEEEK